MKSTIRFVATGDSYITRRLPEPKTESFRELADIIHQGDVRFTNLEVTVHQLEGIPSALSGGQWAMSSPDTLTDLQAYGFNMMAWATNHTMDYLYGGLAATEKYLNERRIVHAGAGLNLARASEPRYLETPAGRVALLAATSTFHDFQRAGEQRPDMIGRPGVNPLRFDTTYKVPPEKLEQLKAIADGVKINARQNMSVKNGYQPPSSSNVFLFGAHTFEASDEEGIVTKPNPADLNRMTQRISEARRQADYVLVSIHSHDLRGDVWEEPAQFVETFSRACMDAGADAVIGHGPHILRGIEIYRGRP
ncbi:MAG: capsule biosynthesis protein, partial [Paenibacillus sp.]|nr:capsule biosynthesis protein [Paenibacillus sp.]